MTLMNKKVNDEENSNYSGQEKILLMVLRYILKLQNKLMHAYVAGTKINLYVIILEGGMILRLEAAFSFITGN